MKEEKEGMIGRKGKKAGRKEGRKGCTLSRKFCKMKEGKEGNEGRK
jgi:hypothetical protein